MMELLGPYPEELWRDGKFARDFFDRSVRDAIMAILQLVGNAVVHFIL